MESSSLHLLRRALGFVAGILTVASAQGDAVKVSSFGFDPEDSTRFMQAALDSDKPEIVVDRMPSPWIVTPLAGRGGKRIILEKGVEIAAKRGAFTNTGARLLGFTSCSNVAIVGRGATIRMWKEDYQKPPYAKSEYRHALVFESCENVSVEGLEIIGAGGDCIYLGGRFAPCRNVALKGVSCVGGNRQGLSVISADGLLAENCVFRDTRGTPPAAGVDFEPNFWWQRAKNVRLRDCVFSGNEGNGIEFALGWFDGRTEPVDVVLENCRSEDNGRAAFKVFCGNNDKTRSDQVRGRITSRGCVYCSQRGLAVVLAKSDTNSVSMAFEDCLWRESGMSSYRILKDADWRSREAHVTYVGDAGAVQRAEADFSAAQVIDATPGEMTKFPKISARYSVRYAFYAERARTVRLALKLRPIAPNRPAPTKKLTLRDATGQVVAVMPAPDPSEGELAFAVPGPGFYVLAVDVRSNGIAELSGADVPIAFDVSSGGLSLQKPNCRLFFDAPESDVPAVARVSGGGMNEQVAAKLMDPAGKAVWEKGDAIHAFFVALPRPRKTGAWSLSLSRSRTGQWDDASASVIGVPGFLFPVEGRRWTFAGRNWRKAANQ